MFGFFLRVMSASTIILGAVIILMQPLGQMHANHIIAYSMSSDPTHDNHNLRFHDTSTGITYRQIDSEARHYDVVWSPDGHEIAYQNHDASDWVLSLDSIVSPESRRLVEDAHFAGNMRMLWSPSGDSIIFTNYRDTGSRLILLQSLDIETGIVSDISRVGTLEQPTFVAWLPRGEHLVVRADFPLVHARFAIVDLDNPFQLQHLPPELNLYELMLPLSDATGFVLLAGWEIATLAMDDLANPQTLHDSHVAYTHLALSPDNRHAAFISKPPPTYVGPWTLSVIDIETGDYEIILLTEGILRSVAWSHDGEWLVYSFTPTHSTGMYREIYIMRPDGSQHRLIDSGIMLNTQPAWRP